MFGLFETLIEHPKRQLRRKSGDSVENDYSFARASFVAGRVDQLPERSGQRPWQRAAGVDDFLSRTR
jgi:hypothetical protein